MNNILLLSGSTNLRDEYFIDLLNSIQHAKRKIHAAMYWLEYDPNKGPNSRPNMLLNAIAEAKRRGVDVRLIFYSGSTNLFPALIPFLDNNGIPYKMLGTHAKVTNIDDEFVYVGTGNWNSNGLRNNHEAHIKSYNPNIINRVATYLDKLWNGLGRQAYSDDQYDNVLVTNGYFDTVLNHIQTARNSIRVLMFQSEGYKNNDPDHMPTQLLKALVDAKNRGVSVKVILDGDYDGNNDGTISNAAAMNYLKSNGIQAKYDEVDPPRTHIKMVIIDGVVFIGAHNWLQIQLASTNETTVKLRSPFIVDDALRYFDWKWERGRSP
jgi:phosphatidylserine/phosphatidylglycerophosphate/cardiolipin synthase-like enzyme